MSWKGSAESRVTLEKNFAGITLSFESGWMAKQAHGAVVARQGDTIVLATVCEAGAKPGQGFFPLTCEYVEKAYAAGKIPGGYFKREGKLAEHEVLSSRLMDRPIRPLFPEGYVNEVQIIATVISADGENSPDMLAISAASAALHISSLPFQGPLAGVRVGRVDGQFVLNPTKTQLLKSDIDLVVAGTSDAIVMVEGGADNVPESEILDALYYGHRELQNIIAMQEELRAKVGKPKSIPAPLVRDQEVWTKVSETAQAELKAALTTHDKAERGEKFKAIETRVATELAEQFPEKGSVIHEAIHDLTKELMRDQILSQKKRIDGRGLADVRPIECQVGVLPRTHGSALFTRGETQALVTATLGTSVDAQKIDLLTELEERTFMLHYNFPPFSTGEAKMLRGTGRREVGHGALAERSVKRVLPDQKSFPYVLRVVSDILESNGSSSMASVCGASLSLMDAGVPLKDAVAGVAMGLIKEGDKVAVLTDILGDEDHFGDMDFKVCGTKTGVTGLQMDIKCKGLSRETMEQALEQARIGRTHILGEMAKVINTQRGTMSKFAPQIESMKINPDKIRDLIGPGGKTIRSITESCHVKIDVNDEGIVTVSGTDSESRTRAIQIIKGLTEEAEIGRIYDGIVKRIVDFGAFVEILPGVEGLVHISQLDNERVREVSDILREGDQVPVKVLEIDRQGRIRLSRKEALAEMAEA
jgi:polyribonucleotide nucleotidyltransferase